MLVALDLVLLRRTGHDRGHVDRLEVNLVLVGPVGLREDREHLLRGLGRGEVVHEVRRILLHPVGPRRAAARDERELAVVREALDELRAFLHDRDVGGEVGVEHLLESETAEGRVDLTRGELARLHAERLAKRDADRRGDLDDAGLLGIAERAPDLGGLVVLVDRADRAVRGALSALDARGLLERERRRRGHDGPLAAADELERPHVLHLLADLGAASALDALVGIQDDRARGAVVLVMDDFLRERVLADAEVGRQLLKLAGARARALQAVVRVVRENELEDRAARLDDLGIVRDHAHAFLHLGDASAQQLARGFPLRGILAVLLELADDADAAARARLEVRMIAQGRDRDTGLLGGLKDVPALLSLHLDAVDLDIDKFSSH